MSSAAPQRKNPKPRWIWLDLEMSGLDVEQHRILEIATVITDPQLNIVAEGSALAIHQSDEILDAMDEWCTETHGESGLTERVQQSKLNEMEAQRQVLDFLQLDVEPGVSPLCGNSVWQDRRFLMRYMPALAQFFHYRNLDVSSLKILAQQWAPQLIANQQKHSRHRALDDVYDSIAELKYYRQQMFLPKYSQNQR